MDLRYNVNPRDHQKNINYSHDQGVTVISLDTIFRAGIPYAIFSPWAHGADDRTAKIFALSGRDRIEISKIVHFDSSYLEYKFIGSAIAETKNMPEYGVSDVTLVDPIVNADIFQPHGFNYEHLVTFLHPAFQSKAPAAQEERPTWGKMVERDYSKPIITKDGKIYQAGILVGRYEYKESPGLNKIPEMEYQIYYLDEYMCADIVSVSTDLSQQIMVTLKDKKSKIMKRDFSAHGLIVILEYLASEGYL